MINDNSNNRTTSPPDGDVEGVRKAPSIDGKRPVEISTPAFLFTAVVGVPLWLTVVLPLTLVYQSGRALSSLGKSNTSSSTSSIREQSPTILEDLEPVNLIPLKERRYDVVLLGATGFTGSLAAKYLYQNYHSKKNFRWALAGRSKDKLEIVLKRLQDEDTNEKDSNHTASNTMDGKQNSVDLLIVDTLKPNTLHDLVKDTKCVITTAGPFCKYGSNVVEYCARYGTNYVDITGEIGWNKEMIMKWDALAQHTGAKIVSLCGCDSIPWDLTYFKLSQMLQRDCQDVISKLTCYDELRGGISGGTVDTMLTFLEAKYQTPRFPFDPYYRKRDGSKSKNKTKDMSSLFIGRKTELNGTKSKWTNPFIMSSVNSELIKRSHALNDQCMTGSGQPQQPLIYREANVQKSFKEAFVTWFGTVLGATALLNPITGTPIKKYLIPKPGEGPSEKEMSQGYLLVSGVGEGIKGSMVESEFYFPVDAGYKDTARMVSEAGLCLALDSEKLPVQGGGFYSPSAAMGDMLLERLCKSGCKFASRVVQMQGEKLKSKL
jgi:Uncharacterized conserved protein